MGRSSVEYILDQLGSGNFRLLTSDLVQELTGWSGQADREGPSAPQNDSAPAVVRFPAFLGGEVWSGTIAEHVIYLPGKASGDQNLSRVKGPIKAQLEKYVLARQRADEQATRHAEANERSLPFDPMDLLGQQLPDYVIFHTNVSLADVSEADLDALRASIAEASAKIGMKGWKLWHYADYRDMLTAAVRTRRKYIAQIAPKAFLKVIQDYDVGVSGRLARAVRVQAINELKAERWVRLSQPGGSDQYRLALSSVGIDLPLTGQLAKAARFIIETSDDAGIKRRYGKAVPNILLLGGPGQGKSTISRLVCQAYRIALLKDSLDPGHDTFPLSASIERGLQDARIPLPSVCRWPVRIEMAHYVDDSINHSRKSLIKYIAEQAEEYSEGMNSPLVRHWLEAWPWLLILDGFDEVASLEGREILLEQLSYFMGEVEGLGADVFVLATTRPQGYAEEFTPYGYRSISLADLDARQAVEYGLKLAQARHGEDPEMLDKVTDRLALAANDNFTARLMQSPLQVSIMSTLLEARERVPRARYELFDAYYETIYARETGKPGPLAAMLEERPKAIHSIHNWLGLVLQANSEHVGELDASLPLKALRAYAVEGLLEEGHDAAQAAQLADRIIQAVTTRLVLIVPKNDTDVGFEVRSIQEFFAARAISSGPDTAILKRLQALVEPAHWRNTWLLAAGKAFFDHDHLRRQIISILPDVDNGDLLRGVVAPGADLALDVLGDNLADQSPGLQRNLYRHALTLLDYAPDPDLRRRAPVLFTLAENDANLAFWLEHAVDQAVGGTLAQLEAIRVVLELADRRATPLALRFRPRLREVERLIKARKSDVAYADLRSLGDALESLLAGGHVSRADRRLVKNLAGQLAGVPITWSADTSDSADAAVPRDLIESCLSRERIASLLAEATVTALRMNSTAGARLRNMLKIWIQRRTVGQEVLELTYPSTAERMKG